MAVLAERERAAIRSEKSGLEMTGAVLAERERAAIRSGPSRKNSRSRVLAERERAAIRSRMEVIAALDPKF